MRPELCPAGFGVALLATAILVPEIQCDCRAAMSRRSGACTITWSSLRRGIACACARVARSRERFGSLGGGWTAKPNCRLQFSVGTTKKSHAALTSVWLARKVPRLSDGLPLRALTVHYATVDSAPSWSSKASSSRILGTPQRTLPIGMRPIPWMICMALGDAFDFRRQQQRRPFRC